MTRYTAIISFIIGIPVFVLLGSLILQNAHDSGGKNVPSDWSYVKHELKPEVDIEIQSTGVGALDGWIQHRVDNIYGEYLQNTSDIGIEEWQTPVLRIRANSSQWNGYTNIVLDVYEYTGGAHGYPFVETAVADTERGVIVGLGDVFGFDNFLNKLSRLMLRKVSDLHEVFEAEIIRDALSPQATNFERWTVGPDGVTFLYNPYEIAAFSVGIVPVTITWEEIQELQ